MEKNLNHTITKTKNQNQESKYHVGKNNRQSFARTKKWPFCSVQMWYATALTVWPVLCNAFQERCWLFGENPGAPEVLEM